MSNVQALDVKKLRDQTGSGFVACKQALAATNNDFEKARLWLKKQGLSIVEKKSHREALEGSITSYIHGNHRIGVLLEINSETDFVARSQEFQSFAHDVSMHIAAMKPRYLKEEDIPKADLEKEKQNFKELAKEKSKNESTLVQIEKGLYKKWISEVCLLNQEFIKENAEKKQTIEQALTQLIAKVGENILIRRFVCFSLGETSIKHA